MESFATLSFSRLHTSSRHCKQAPPKSPSWRADSLRRNASEVYNTPPPGSPQWSSRLIAIIAFFPPISPAGFIPAQRRTGRRIRCASGWAAAEVNPSLRPPLPSLRRYAASCLACQATNIIPELPVGSDLLISSDLVRVAYCCYFAVFRMCRGLIPYTRRKPCSRRVQLGLIHDSAWHSPENVRQGRPRRDDASHESNRSGRCPPLV
jgi:hypothetical protein